MLGLTPLEELGGHLREQGVGQDVLLLDRVVFDLFAEGVQFRRDQVRRAAGFDTLHIQSSVFKIFA